MKTSKLLIVIATISLILTPFSLHASRGIRVEPISPTGERVTGNQWLFVIGIDTYIEWPRLKTAVNDAKSVKNVLLSHYHFNSDHLIELYDEDATRANILYKLRWLAQNIVEDDSLFIFYAGHGHLDPITKSGSWIPVESGTKDVSAWISNNDIKNYLRVDAIKAKHILLVSDSCFSGDFFRGHRGKLPEVTDAVIKKAYTLSSRQALTSGGLEPVSDAGFGNNSVFSYFLVKTLEENKAPFLVPSVLFSSIRTGVAENAEQFPQFGSLKDTGGQQGGELVLFLKQDARLQDLSDITNKKLKKIERLQQMELEAKEARRKEAEEISKREKDLAELDAKIEAMKNRLGTSAVSTDDNLDNMLAMVEQKEMQKKRLYELRRQKEEDERKRNDEIAKLKKEREDKIITALTIEVEKYKKIISSEFGKSMKSAAWQSLIAKCPPGWADGVDEGNYQTLLRTPVERLRLKELEIVKIRSVNASPTMVSSSLVDVVVRSPRKVVNAVGLHVMFARRRHIVLTAVNWEDWNNDWPTFSVVFNTDSVEGTMEASVVGCDAANGLVILIISRSKLGTKTLPAAVPLEPTVVGPLARTIPFVSDILKEGQSSHPLPSSYSFRDDLYLLLKAVLATLSDEERASANGRKIRHYTQRLVGTY